MEAASGFQQLEARLQAFAALQQRLQTESDNLATAHQPERQHL